MFISAGNSGPGLNTIGDPSVATKVMSVGAYVHKDTWLNNYGAVATKTDGMFVFSSRGPREDGGFKPNISAPGSAVSSIPAWQSPPVSALPTRAARVCHVQRHVDGLSAGGRCGCTPAQRGDSVGRAASPRPAPPGDQLERSLPALLRGPRAGQRPASGRCRVGSAEDQHQDGGDRELGSGQDDHQPVPRHPDVGSGLYEREGLAARRHWFTVRSR